MTTDVFTVRVDKKLLIADSIMEWAHVRHVPVVDETNRLVGLVTHRDLLRASVEAFAGSQGETLQFDNLAQKTVRDVMRDEVATIDPQASIAAAARVMRRGKYGCLPVVNSRNELLGIVTEIDLLEVLEHLDLDDVAPVRA